MSVEKRQRKRKGRPLLTKVMVSMVILGVLQAVVFIAIMLISGELTYIEKYSSDFLIEKTSNRAFYMKNTLTQKTALASQEASDISERITTMLEERGVSAKALSADKDVSRDILGAVSPDLIALMRANGVNDAFIILETGDLYGEDVRPGCTSVTLTHTRTARPAMRIFPWKWEALTSHIPLAQRLTMNGRRCLTCPLITTLIFTRYL